MKDKIIIVGGGNHHNALGVIRALGRCGLRKDIHWLCMVTHMYILRKAVV